MHPLTSIALQVGLIFGPVIILIFLKVITSFRVIHYFGAVVLASLAGVSASYFIAVHAWRPRMKYNGSVEFSTSEGFWAIFIGMLVLLLMLAHHKPRKIDGAIDGKGERTADSAADSRRWRVGHIGRDRMFYEEFHAGTWRRIEIDGEMLMGPAHHVIYFASPEKWESFPDWARGRRDEIIARIKSEFAAPEYEYYGG